MKNGSYFGNLLEIKKQIFVNGSVKNKSSDSSKDVSEYCINMNSSLSSAERCNTYKGYLSWKLMLIFVQFSQQIINFIFRQIGIPEIGHRITA